MAGPTKKLKKLTLDDAVLHNRSEAGELPLIQELEGDHDTVNLVDGHLAVDGDLVLDGNPGLVVSGNLTVKGDVINRDGDVGPPLIVGGDLKARNLVGGGSEIIVLGSAKVSNTVYGHYNHGEIRIDGDLRAKAWITNDHSMWVAGKLLAPTGGTEGDFAVDEAEKAYQKRLVVDGQMDHDAFLTRILSNNKSPFKPGAKPPRLVVLEEVNAIADAGEVTSIDLTDVGLDAYTPSIESLPLERLSLPSFGGDGIPASISALAPTLRELYVDGWVRGLLPESLYELEHLEVLSIGYAMGDGALRDGISALDEIQVLSLQGNSSLPADIGRMSTLRELDISGVSSVQMTAFPEQVLGLEQLEVLRCADQSFESLPDLSPLKSLHTLDLSNGLGTLSSPPDLSALPNLRHLGFSGGRPTTSSPYPEAEMLEAVRGLDSLETLVLARWREETGFSSARAGFAFPDDIFEGLGNLRHVGLSVCDLTRIPESLFDIESLESITLAMNRDLPDAALERIRERWPGILVDVGPRFDVWQHIHPMRVYGTLGDDAHLGFRRASIPDGSRIEVWARGRKSRKKWHPWIEIGHIDPAIETLGLKQPLTAAKQGDTDEYQLQLRHIPARGDGPTRFPHVGMVWTEL